MEGNAYIGFRYISGSKTRVILSLTIFGVSEWHTRTVQQKYRKMRWMMVQKSLMVSVSNNKTGTKSKTGVFERIVMDAVEKVFSSLDESCKQAIYRHLSNSFNITKEQIPHKIDAFANALEEMFGAGAKLIKIEIMKLTFSQVKTIKNQTKQDALSFTDYMKKLGDL